MAENRKAKARAATLAAAKSPVLILLSPIADLRGGALQKRGGVYG